MAQPAEVLYALGRTAEEVAETLRTEGIQGVRNAVRFLNPTVRFVQKRLGSEIAAAHLIKPNHLTVTHADGRLEETPLTTAVIEFQKRFDRGDYPELLLP
jgi:hypothetical protein